jgi:hypothetical protein
MRTWGFVVAVELALVATGVIVAALIVMQPFSAGNAEAPGDLPPVVQLRDPPTPIPVTPAPTPDPLRCGSTVDQAYMRDTQILSYYGSPYTAQMGILGALDPATLVAEVKAHAETYDALNGFRSVRPALHIVYGAAQAAPGLDGDYLLYVDDATMREYIDLACENDLLVFVDMQIGRSDVETEVRKTLPYLELPNVHLAIDPEFAMAHGEVPGQRIGTIDAADLNAAQTVVEEFIEAEGLDDKILVVHQFLDKMITRPELIVDFERVRLVVDMDGFGPSSTSDTGPSSKLERTQPKGLTFDG